jgi:hypothetical protein
MLQLEESFELIHIVRLDSARENPLSNIVSFLGRSLGVDNMQCLSHHLCRVSNAMQLVSATSGRLKHCICYSSSIETCVAYRNHSKQLTAGALLEPRR